MSTEIENRNLPVRSSRSLPAIADRTSRVIFSSPNSDDEDDVSFAELWRILRKRRWIVAACIVGFSALALFASLLMTPKYEASSTIEVNKENSDMLGIDDMGSMMSGGSDSLDYNVTLQTQTNVLQSDSLALQVVQQLGLEKREEFGGGSKLHWTLFRKSPDPEANLPLEKAPRRRARVLAAFQKNLTVKTVPGTRMIEVHFLSPDPQVSADIVNTLVNDYLEQYFRTRFSATMQASDWLSKQLDDLKGQVEQSQQKLVQYQKQTGILGTDENNNIVMVKLGELNTQLTAAEANRIMKQAVWQIAKSGNAELISGMAGAGLMPGSGGANPSSLLLIQNLRAQQAELKVQYAQAASKYGSAYPKLLQLKSQLQEIDIAIQAEVQKLAARAENDYIAAQQTESMLRGSFERQKQEANRMNDSAIQYGILKREVESSRDLYEGLLKKLKEAGVLAGLRSTNIVVVDAASPAPDPARPRTLLNIAIGLAAGLFGGIALAFVLENMDHTITTPDQAEIVTSLPSLGIVPDSKSMAKNLPLLGNRGASTAALPEGVPDIAVVSNPQSQIAEAYRSLRTSILLTHAENATKVIMVTSSLPQEGKTTTSLNVAAALAQQGKRVLLVEADLRRPSIAKRLNLSVSSGLTSLLGSVNGFKPPVVEVPAIPGLCLLPAGPKPPFPAELLGSHRMDEFIAKWRTEFDNLVIDTPPVLSVTDAVVLSAKADAVVLVIRSGVTTKQSLVRAREILKRADARFAGVLVNAVNLNSPDHYYYYGYYYGSKYGRGYYEDSDS